MTLTLDQIEASLEDAVRRRAERKLDFYVPYPKQAEFHNAGAYIRERLLMAGNQVGKTYSGAAETAFHLTGLYQDDWMGRRWDRPVRGWAAGESSLAVRDVQQKLLCGEPGVDAAFGTGLIPKECFSDKPSLARGVTDAYDTIQIKHSNNGGDTIDGISVLRFKSYEQGRTKMQGESIDFFWCDEEPDGPIYREILTRTNATGGMGFMTFTPLKGRSEVVTTFLDEASPDRLVINMTLDDAAHYSAAQKVIIIASYPEHEREARVKGIPMLGSGLIFAVPEAMIEEETLQYIPPHWTKLWGLDFGIADNHPFAAVLSLWDRDLDIVHVHHVIKMVGGRVDQHVAHVKGVAAGVPCAWPHDGHQRDKNGINIRTHYAKQGLLMLPSHSTFPEGGYSVEGGLFEMSERMQTGRLKVAKHLRSWWDEKRLYHRKDGLIVKNNDDVMDATRQCIMAKRFGKAVQLGRVMQSQGSAGRMARDVDFDVFDAT